MDALGSDVLKPRLAVAPPEPEPKPADARSKAGDKTDNKTGDKAPPQIEAKSAPEPTHGKVADKDVARESWRKNLPDITAEPGKSALLVPVKGSMDGATYHVTTKPKSVLITMPKAESMITMPFYNIRHDGFRQLWIKTDESTKVTTIRVVLGDATDPQVEIKDDFVRVTVRRPVEASGNAEAPTAAAPTPPEASSSAPSAPPSSAPSVPSVPSTPSAPPSTPSAPPPPGHD
jgi:hypothetical protein